MTDLRTIELSGCRSPHIFAQALQPSMNSSEVVVCPKLEELILESPDGVFDIKSVTKMAAARASRGKKLRTVKLVDRQGELDPKVILELKKHVSYVECASELARLMVNSDTEDRRGGGSGKCLPGELVRVCILIWCLCSIFDLGSSEQRYFPTLTCTTMSD